VLRREGRERRSGFCERRAKLQERAKRCKRRRIDMRLRQSALVKKSLRDFLR
jgi:hypothetical protein